MKIIQFMASEKWGGAEKVFVDLSNQLAQNHQVFALVLRDTEYLHRFSSKVTIVELKSHPTSRNPLLMLEIRKTVNKIEADLIHTHAGKASELVKNSLIFTGIKHLATKHNARKGNIFNKLNFVTVVSEEAMKSVKKREESKIWVVYNGIKPKLSGNEFCKYRQKRSVFTISAIGRLDKIKGFDVLIKQVRSCNFPYKLDIYGQGGEFESLKALIEKYQMQGDVTLHGFCDEIPQRMHESDLVVISSFSEGFPNVMVESLYYANVLVSTPVGGVVEVLPKIFLCDQNELATKINDVATRYSYYCEQFEILKKQRAKHFSLENVVQKYEDIYREMLEA